MNSILKKELNLIDGQYKFETTGVNKKKDDLINFILFLFLESWSLSFHR